MYLLASNSLAGADYDQDFRRGAAISTFMNQIVSSSTTTITTTATPATPPTITTTFLNQIVSSLMLLEDSQGSLGSAFWEIMIGEACPIFCRRFVFFFW